MCSRHLLSGSLVGARADEGLSPIWSRTPSLNAALPEPGQSQWEVRAVVSPGMSHPGTAQGDFTGSAFGQSSSPGWLCPQSGAPPAAEPWSASLGQKAVWAEGTCRPRTAATYLSSASCLADCTIPGQAPGSCGRPSPWGGLGRAGEQGFLQVHPSQEGHGPTLPIVVRGPPGRASQRRCRVRRALEE